MGGVPYIFPGSRALKPFCGTSPALKGTSPRRDPRNCRIFTAFQVDSDRELQTLNLKLPNLKPHVKPIRAGAIHDDSGTLDLSCYRELKRLANKDQDMFWFVSELNWDLAFEVRPRCRCFV